MERGKKKSRIILEQKCVVNGRKYSAVNLILRAYYDAMLNNSDEDQGVIITHLRKHFGKVMKRKKVLRRAASYEIRHSKNRNYRLFLEYVKVFGEL